MNPDDPKAAVKELLLEEYRALSESFWKNEATGDTRVNLFIGLVTAIAGGLLAMHGKDSSVPENLRLPVMISALFALLLLGLITWLRMLTRNEATDRYKDGLDKVRQVFRDHFDDGHVLLHYHAFATPKKKKKKEEKTIEENYTRKFGGLAHTMVAINSLLTLALAVAVARGVSPDTWVTVIAALVGFIVSLKWQLWYMDFRKDREDVELKKGNPSHAGGIVYKSDGGAIKYLIIRPKDNTTEWVLPKGKIEYREGHAEAALREVREETGVVANLVGYIGRMEFKTKEGESSIAKLYLMEEFFTDPVDAIREGRNPIWEPYAVARGKLTHIESKHLLDAAEALQRKRGARDKAGAEK